MKHIIKATVYDRNNNVISIGFNSYSKTHPLQYHYAAKAKQPEKIYLHAEIAALIKAKKKGYRITIERYNKQGKPMLAAPCPICLLAIKEAGIEIVQHTV